MPTPYVLMTIETLRSLVPTEGQRGVEAQIKAWNEAVASPDVMVVADCGLDRVLRWCIPTVTGARRRHAGFRKRAASYSYVTVALARDYRDALANLPAGTVTAAPALTGEVAVKITPRLYRRYRYDRAGGCVWQPVGIAVRLSRDVEDYHRQVRQEKYWEHGADEAECLAERDRKNAIVATRQREYLRTHCDERRARLIARLCKGRTVTASDVHAAGACNAGIAAWCAAHGVSPDAALPLPELARDKSARYYALQIARRMRRGA